MVKEWLPLCTGGIEVHSVLVKKLDSEDNKELCGRCDSRNPLTRGVSLRLSTKLLGPRERSLARCSNQDYR
jgi:hypothetical protein